MSNNALERTGESVTKTSIIRSASLAIVVAATPALARDLQAVSNPFGVALHIDQSSIHRTGAMVSFTFVMGTKPEGSNAIDTSIDCEARTYGTQRVLVYSKAMAEGEVKIDSKPPKAEREQKPVPARSTWEYLADKVCLPAAQVGR